MPNARTTTGTQNWLSVKMALAVGARMMITTLFG